MNCPTHELLSSYVDGEASAADSRRLEFHLGQCAACLGSARLLRAMKARLASLPAPEMPRDLAQALERTSLEHIPLVPAARNSSWDRMRRRAYAWGLCTAVVMAFVFWRQSRRGSPEEVSVEWLLAEHRHDAAELPFAVAERIVPEDPTEEVSHGL